MHARYNDVGLSLIKCFCADYRRATSGMAVIAMFLCPLSIAFGVYALKQARYMFKRVASGVHLITGEERVIYLLNLLVAVKGA